MMFFTFGISFTPRCTACDSDLAAMTFDADVRPRRAAARSASTTAARIAGDLALRRIAEHHREGDGVALHGHVLDIFALRHTAGRCWGQ